MAKAFNGWQTRNQQFLNYFSRFRASSLRVIIVALLLLLPSSSIVNRCPELSVVQALPIGLQLVDHWIVNRFDSTIGSVNRSIISQEQELQFIKKSPSPDEVTDVIQTLQSSNNDHRVDINSTDSISKSVDDHHHHIVADNSQENSNRDSLSIVIDKHLKEEDNSKALFVIEILLRIVIFIYCCLVIGYLCDEYFVPSLNSIGQTLNLRDDLIGAILIPFGTSGPEIFSSAIGVFFTENDIGTGAIIGSGVFNILAIPAASGLAAAYFIGKSIRLDKHAVLRDLTFYFISIIVLILAIKDNTVDFIDSLLFTILFVVYIGVMFYSATSGQEQPEKKPQNLSPIQSVEKPLQQKQHSENDRKCLQNNNQQQPLSTGGIHLPNLTINFDNNFKTEKSPITKNGKNKIMKEYLNKCNEIAKINNLLIKDNRISNHNHQQPQPDSNEKFEDKFKFEIFIENIIVQDAKLLKSKSDYEKLGDECDDNGVGFTNNIILRIILMPFIVIYSITMPAKWPVVTFFFSIVWLSLLSYVTVWSISGLSDMIGIPSTISGMTILAAGSAVPDLVTSIIVIKKTGQASMGICAAIASNIFAILLGLGLPWAIQFSLNWIKTGTYQKSMIILQSSALPYTSILLLGIVALLYLTFKQCDWKISKQFSFICFLLHVAFVVCSIFLEISIS